MSEVYLPDGGIDYYPELELTADEYGDYNECFCGEYFRYDPKTYKFFCPCCSTMYSRKDYFNYIGANDFKQVCLNDCNDNYPLCREYCERYNDDKIK